MVEPHRPQMTLYCSVCASTYGLCMLQTHTQNINVGYMKTPLCYDIICTLCVLFSFLYILNKLRSFMIYTAQMIWNLWIYSEHKHTYSQQNLSSKAFAWENLISTAQMAFPIYVYFCSPFVSYCTCACNTQLKFQQSLNA